MTFKKNFVCAIKVGGKVLRESSGRVELPFGSEYSVLLKNLDSVRMQARISIDGKEATGWLIIGPNQSIDVERFVEDLDRGNRFKFIERTERIEEHRGIKAEDGLVRVEFKREKIYEVPQVAIHHTYHHYYPGGCYGWHYPYYGPFYSGNYCRALNQNVQTATSAVTTAGLSGVTYTSASGSVAGAQANNVSYSAQNLQANNVSANANDAGITVPGSLSDQKFISVSGFETEQSEVVVLYLVGKKAGAPVQVAKTVHTLLQCETCGRTSKSSAKFCKECGTSLEKV
jgi:hypothetical protein